MLTLVKTSPALLYSRLSSLTQILCRVVLIGDMAIASSGRHSYSFITMAALLSEGGIHKGQVYLVGPSEDKLQLWTRARFPWQNSSFCREGVVPSVIIGFGNRICSV